MHGPAFQLDRSRQELTPILIPRSQLDIEQDRARGRAF